MDKKMVFGILIGIIISFCFSVLFNPEPLQQVSAGGGAKGVIDNGDVNGNGKTDLADAVYLLSYLFAEGDEPVAIECEENPEPGLLAATGQTRCYDAEGFEIDCNSSDFPGQDGFYQAGFAMENRFHDNGDGTVTDNCTGLIWQQETSDINSDGVISEADRLFWQGALRYCDSLEFADHDDWRLPNVRELQSIVDYGRRNPAIDPVFQVEPSWYWSSTSYNYYPDKEWCVLFYSGYVSSELKNTASYIRAVRG